MNSFIGNFLFILSVVNYSVTEFAPCEQVNNYVDDACTNYLRSIKTASKKLITEYTALLRTDQSPICVLSVKSAIDQQLLPFKDAVDQNVSDVLMEYLNGINGGFQSLDVRSQFISNNNCNNFNSDVIINHIRRGDHIEASKIFHRYNLLLNKTIVQAYGKNGPFAEKIVDFIDLLYSENEKQNKMYGYRILLDQMISNDDLNNFATMTIAYRAMHYLTPSDDVTYIKNKLPTHIKAFPWGKEVKIQNRQFSDFFYGSSVTSAGRRSCFNKIQGSCTDSSCHWNVEPKNGGNYNLLSIQVLHEKEYLYEETKEFAYDKERITVFTNMNGDIPVQSGWQFEPVRDTEFYRIKNAYSGLYLFAGGDGFKYNSANRRTVTWAPGGCDGKACQWKLIPQ